MRIHSLEHAASEGPGKILEWAAARGHSVTHTALHAGEALPSFETFDVLLVMGGPMNIYQYRDYPWLRDEKRYLREAIDAKKPVIGICLGSQLLADVLGGKVFQNSEKEIGWFPVKILERDGLLAGFPSDLMVMHWHGDTFSMPPNTRRIAESVACVNQGFVYHDRVIGLQFHLELGVDGVAELSAECESELVPAKYVQTRGQLLQPPQGIDQTYAALCSLMDAMVGRVGSKQ